MTPAFHFNMVFAFILRFEDPRNGSTCQVEVLKENWMLGRNDGTLFSKMLV